MFREDLSMFESRGTEDYRKKCLLAMAVALGADEADAQQKIEWMFQMAEDLGKIDFSRGLDGCDAETERKIRRIGEILSNDRGTQQYAIGVMALRLIRDPLDSEAFSKLKESVDRWNFGQGTGRFDEIIGQK